MRQYAVVTGPTERKTEEWTSLDAVHRRDLAPFADQLNTKLLELAQTGVDPEQVTVECMPDNRPGFHVAYLSWESTRATSYSVQQLSQRTGIPARTITAMVARGDLPRLHARTRRVYIPAGHPAVAKLLSTQQ